MANNKIKNATAVYTGGGIWLFYGELESGLHFLTDDNGSTLLLDESAENMDESLYEEWQTAHQVEELEEEEAVRFIDSLLDYLSRLPQNDRGGISDTEIDRYRVSMKAVFGVYADEMPAELRTMLQQLESLCECGSIRSYYDTEAVEVWSGYKYTDSAPVHNLLCFVEEVAWMLRKGEVKKAETFIRDYFKG